MTKSVSPVVTAVGFHAVLRQAIASSPPATADWASDTNSTRYMTDRLVDVAQALRLHVCAKTLRSPVPGKHERREYMFDVTMYAEWKAYSLPAVLVEHENLHRTEAFLYDFWKLMMGFAPLRVMIGYAKSRAQAEALAAEVASMRVPAPSTTEDLLMIGHARMDPLGWVSRARVDGMAWSVLDSDGSTSHDGGHRRRRRSPTRP